MASRLLEVFGTDTVAIPAGTTAVTVVKASAGRLCRALLSTSDSAAVEIYDHASAASGTLIGFIPGNAAAGTSVEFNMPASLGITVKGSSDLPALVVSFS